MISIPARKFSGITKCVYPTASAFPLKPCQKVFSCARCSRRKNYPQEYPRNTPSFVATLRIERIPCFSDNKTLSHILRDAKKRTRAYFEDTILFYDWVGFIFLPSLEIEPGLIFGLAFLSEKHVGS